MFLSTTFFFPPSQQYLQPVLFLAVCGSTQTCKLRKWTTEWPICHLAVAEWRFGVTQTIQSMQRLSDWLICTDLTLQNPYGYPLTSHF